MLCVFLSLVVFRVVFFFFFEKCFCLNLDFYPNNLNKGVPCFIVELIQIFKCIATHLLGFFLSFLIRWLILGTRLRTLSKLGQNFFLFLKKLVVCLLLPLYFSPFSLGLSS